MSAPLSKRDGILIMVPLTLCWGANWPAMSIALTEIPVWTFRALCLALGGAGLLAISLAGRASLRIPRRELRPLLICSFFNITAWHLLSAAGLQLLPAGRASIIAFTMPLWAGLIAWPVLGERPTVRSLGGLGLGLAGIAALIVPEWESIAAAPYGVLAMIGAAIGWASGTVGVKYWRWTMPTTVLTGWQILLGGIPVIIGAPIFDWGYGFDNVDGRGWIALAYTILVAMLFCQWAWFKVVATFPAQLAAISSLAIPIVGVVSSSLLTGETIGLDIVVALACVLSGLALVLLRPAKRPAASPARAGG
ncbi:transporter [Hypericibacter adhaerens]|uniref:Transporter n=1 Tax=Hypericibacter adhaerens TaxID=2602016 RepID=A0A5J6MWU7_9PROT|nr:DMT family transporter [Hypericibacter adhaerens]QEX20680.1 transporter [Hypericibacter adhaerens]